MSAALHTAYKIKTLGSLTYYQLNAFPIWHAFFARTGGLSEYPYASLNTASTTQDSRAAANRELLHRTFGIENCLIRVLNPCHGAEIRFMDANAWQLSSQAVLYQTDAAFTRTPDSYFLLSTADCIPAVFSDTAGSFAGIVHLGWRNLMAFFAKDVVTTLGRVYSVTPAALRVGIGPAIYPCCYEMEQPLQQHDPWWQPFLNRTSTGLWHVDLLGAFKAQLVESGVASRYIHETGLCTGCHGEKFFSCHRDGYVSGRFPTLVGLRSQR